MISGELSVEPVIRFTAEVALIGVAFWFMLVRLAVARHLAKLGSGRVAVFALLMFLWLSVQLVDRLHPYYPQETTYYPVTRFAMFQHARPVESVPDYYFEGSFADGSSARIDLAEWFPSIEPTSLDNRIGVLAGWLEADSPADSGRAERELRAYVAGLRSVLAETGHQVPPSVSLHATEIRVVDRKVVSDTVVWRMRREGPGP